MTAYRTYAEHQAAKDAEWWAGDDTYMSVVDNDRDEERCARDVSTLPASRREVALDAGWEPRDEWDES